MSHKYSSPHDRALIAFGSDVLAILDSHHEWGSDTLNEIGESAQQIGLGIPDQDQQFRVIPRERFRNRLSL